MHHHRTYWISCCSFCPITFLHVFVPCSDFYYSFSVSRSVRSILQYILQGGSCFIYFIRYCMHILVPPRNNWNIVEGGVKHHKLYTGISHEFHIRSWSHHFNSNVTGAASGAGTIYIYPSRTPVLILVLSGICVVHSFDFCVVGKSKHQIAKLLKISKR